MYKVEEDGHGCSLRASLREPGPLKQSTLNLTTTPQGQHPISLFFFFFFFFFLEED